jgi:diguanylate cyclase (GGDEF)-like protein/putative nucleotidyltransferase with HDIG domain
VQDERAQRGPIAVKLFMGATALVGLALTVLSLPGWTPGLPARFLVYLAISLACSGMNVVFPGVGGNLSVSDVFMMLGVLELEVPEAVILGILLAAAQSYWDAKRRGTKLKLERVFFNAMVVALAVMAACRIYQQPWFSGLAGGGLLRLFLAGVAFFLVNTLLVSTAIALTFRQGALSVWKGIFDWSFPFCLAGVSLAGIVHTATVRLGWPFSVALLPPLYLVYRSIRLYFSKMEQEKAHAEGLASLHLRTIEALATAIEAKDECTGDHLRRVQVYSLELAKHLGLSSDEVNALQAASILHDIGKLAVPDYIISKPGKLTPDEFDKMKVHTVVGAEILEQVAFPYPVAPIVRSHHEKWDGSGYPDGLKAENIPIGARILSAVDCLDALASDRQYRRALPLDEAMDYVAGLSSRAFDPQVVDILKANYREFERLAQSTPLRNHKLSKDLIVSRGDAPDAGFEKSASSTAAAGASGASGVIGAAGAAGAVPAAGDGSGDRVQVPADSVASARQKMRSIVDLAVDLSKSQHTEDVFSMLAERLKQLVPYDCLAIYVRERSILKARYTNGLNSQTLAALEIPVGQGLSGWVVENGKAIINGNPAVEPGYVEVAGPAEALNSALAIPLGDGVEQFSGVLTLYRTEKDAYSADHLRVLLAIKGDIARAVEGALRFQKTETGTVADPLTGLPGKTALLAYLQDGFAAQRKPVTVLLCDIDEFRRVNDLFGRPKGDELLKLVSDILRTNSRNVDYVARVGADEFVLLLAAARPEELAGKMEALNSLVANACRGLCGEESSGLTIGVACFPENGGDAESLMAFAEQALAHAKETRRNSRSGMLQLEHAIRRPT